MVQFTRLMDTTDAKVLPAPPSLMKALTAGFDVISNHISLISFSVALDIFLWLGPHFRLTQLIQSIFTQSTALPELNTPEMSEMMRASKEMWLLMAERFNLFTFLRAYPVGVPSLMVSRSPMDIPGGSPLFWEATSFGIVIGLFVLLSLIGLAIGTYYFDVVSDAVVEGNVRWMKSFREWPWTLSQVLLLTLLFIGILLLVSIPFSCLLSLFLVAGFGLSQISILIFGGLLAWLLMPLFFSPHGIFVKRMNMWHSVKKSVRLIRVTLPTTGLFFLVLLLLSEGLDLLWSVPPETSWLTLVGVAGHAFVTSGLLAASFVYYRDADRWLEKIIQQTKLSSSTES
jgi:hypothetical protein